MVRTAKQEGAEAGTITPAVLWHWADLLIAVQVLVWALLATLFLFGVERAVISSKFLDGYQIPSRALTAAAAPVEPDEAAGSPSE